MVLDVKIRSLLHKNVSRRNVDLLIVSFDFVPNLGHPLRVGELVVDARYDLPLLEPSNFPLKMM